MTREEQEAEFKKQQEEAQKKYQEFLQKLKDLGDKPVSGNILREAISFIANDLEGAGQMSMMAVQQTQYLKGTIDALVGALQGGGRTCAPVNKTPGGIILPH